MSHPRESYDDKQVKAVLTRCVICHREYYMTTPTPVCRDCQERR